MAHTRFVAFTLVPASPDAFLLGAVVTKRLTPTIGGSTKVRIRNIS
jgi:hypothetical protein